MQILHILKSEPDEWVERFINTISEDEGAMVVPLYNDSLSQVEVKRGPKDWQQLVENIFNCRKVICWW